MEKKTISEIGYDLELEKIVREIKIEKARKVLLQFPDGIKLYATAICEELEKKTNAQFFIWFGSCFGACDVPNVKDFDLVVQFGHSEMMPDY